MKFTRRVRATSVVKSKWIVRAIKQMESSNLVRASQTVKSSTKVQLDTRGKLCIM